jgi:outer membrane protein OmpA-like peptidoglycan-associated protein
VYKATAYTINPKHKNMKTVKVILIIFLTILLLGNNISFAQTKFVTRKEGFQKEETKALAHPYITFKNIGKIPYYHNESLLNKINKLNNAKNDKDLLLALEEYISQFGTQNFGKNYDMLWMLGQLYERLGYTENAKWLYRIVIKQSEDDIQLIAQYYDSLTRLEKNYYVPINYYYELVEYRKQVDTLFPPQGVLINMGDEINSKFEDYGPALSFDNNTMIFASKRHRVQRGIYEYVNEDLYISAKENGKWSKAEPLTEINSLYNEGTPCLSKDGQTMYFIRCESPEGLGSCDIFQATITAEGKWGNVKNLGTNVNSSFWESHPSLSVTGDTLYFTSDRPEGFGSNDIYYTYKDKAGKWQPATNMGPIINTKGSDMSPFHHPVYDVLYFSSNTHLLNFGNYDLYKVTRSNGIWQEPKNIGPLVNGKGDEHFFTIDSESENLFYARSEIDNVKDLNIYSFPLPMEAQPLATTVFKGTLKDSITGESFKGIVSIIDLENGIEVAPKYLREDGSFEFDLIDKNKYLLVIQGEDFFRIEELINLDGDTEININTPSIKSFRIQFASIEFESNSAEIKDYMHEDLGKLLDFLLDNPTLKLKISGHTDSKGDPNKNLQLSQNRANAIKQHIEAQATIDEGRIEAIGYGSTVPIIKEEKTEEDRKLNRRVEFEIIKDTSVGIFNND